MGKNREVVVELRETGGKKSEKDFERFMHNTAHRAILLGKGVNNKKKTQVNRQG